MLGLTNPYAHELSEYLGYDIKKLKNYFRMLEVVIRRDGQSNGMIGLFFDGCCNFFTELPAPDKSDELKMFYNIIESYRKPVETTEISNTRSVDRIAKLFMSFSKKIKSKDLTDGR